MERPPPIRGCSVFVMCDPCEFSLWICDRPLFSKLLLLLLLYLKCILSTRSVILGPEHGTVATSPHKPNPFEPQYFVAFPDSCGVDNDVSNRIMVF